MTADHRPALRRMIGAGAWYVPSQVVPPLLRLLALPLFTRVLMPADFGRLAIWTATVTVAIVLVRWTDDVLLRYLPGASDERRRARVVRSWSELLGGASVFVGAGFVLAALVRPSGAKWLLALVFLSEALLNAIQQYARASDRARMFTTSSLIVCCVSLALGLALSPRIGATGLLVGWLLGNGAGIAHSWLRLGGEVSARIAATTTDSGLRREMIRYGIPFAAVHGSWVLVLFIDRYFIEAFAGAAELGLYSLAFGAAYAPLHGLFMAIGFTTYSFAVESFERGGRKEAEDLLGAAVETFQRTALPIAIAAACFAEDLFAVLTAPAFHAAANLVPVLVAALYLQGMLPFVTKVFVLGRRPYEHALAGTLCLSANVMLNLALVPTLGAFGAAWALLFSYGLGLGLVELLSRRFDAIRVPLAGGAAMRVLAISGAVLFGTSHAARDLAPALRLFVVAPAALALAGAAVFRFVPLPSRP